MKNWPLAWLSLTRHQDIASSKEVLLQEHLWNRRPAAVLFDVLPQLLVVQAVVGPVVGQRPMSDPCDWQRYIPKHVSV